MNEVFSIVDASEKNGRGVNVDALEAVDFGDAMIETKTITRPPSWIDSAIGYGYPG